MSEPENADELAKKRIEEEMKRIALETEEKRKADMKKLLGDDVADVEARKKGVDESVQKWSEKGTHKVEEPDIHAAGHAGNAIQSKKEALAKQVEENATKAKSSAEGEGEAPLDPAKAEEIRKKFAKPKPEAAEGADEPATEGDSEMSPEEAAFREGFATIESEETNMVGLEKHIKITGTDVEGRKFTKIKIILPKVEGKTVLQGKQQKPANPGEPPNWDGHFHSLEDIQQRRVEGIDSQHREMYLSPEDFEKHFKMTKGAFAKQPKWKKDKLKKALYLF
mmetsp:Transcript_18498/g.45827  ORF Transcript_18498/g.45827 Transcript_18498/m.45827 type:complete len:280 (+) Transcript_18498:99-938(+)|eukprot:CAMPEP_0113648502 /NCGR_PEP_ID=MMETSP0017_2-20120614/25731_1 /TAXON_ID=2856 /ORGANISM="Cylindrotheca closterium" /LENGTH=279 /DNA_ID=CAMNT_0000560735 /DNA_START=47 /DNA_END=886 /DNA_ORIENTATION=- /assembly_acc=CAM_ASM_000147